MDHLIEEVHKLLTEGRSGSVFSFCLYRRLYALSVISYLHELNNELEGLSNRMDFELDFLALEIQYDKYLRKEYWEKGWLLRHPWFIETTVDDIEINQYTDYLPNGVAKYTFNANMVKSFKNTLRQICDEDRLSWDDIRYAIQTGFNKMLSILSILQKKTQNPPPHLLKKFWATLGLGIDKEDVIIDYSLWKEEQGNLTLQSLKDKQMQLIVEVLSTDFFRFRPNPTRREVSQCKLIIDEDALESGYVLPENIQEQCARFEYFASWKDPDKYILSLDYARLGEYSYYHYTPLGKDLDRMLDFDIQLDAIHKDMVKLNPSLAKYLKDYDQTVLEELIKQCSEILNTCQPHLKEGIRNTFLREFLSKLLYESEIKQEAKEKLLSKKYRNKYLCHIIAALNCFFVFKVDVIKADLARSLSSKFTTTNLESALENIERFERERKGALYEWTKKIIDDLKDNPYNPFMGLSTKSS